ncbi:MAG: 3-deoxy-D-arabinoheptulosonate-7-phosphate synthase [Alphaproteobacteria bacterium]|nr:3-deoxy-D-arabinoheptulosonate-7-phosphate synthase [Alphaproteobacteria bacterium]
MNDMSSRGLPRLRAEIDAIDDEILRLIEQRLAVSDAVAALKDSEGDGRLKFRPRRQAEVIARLAKKVARAPATLVGAVWRELMGHGLQAQARTEIVLCGPIDRAVLEAHVRSHFGYAFPLSWASTDAEALRRARDEEAIAIVAGPLPQLDRRLAICDLVRAPDGTAVAHAVGRVADEDCAVSRPEPAAGAPVSGALAPAWSPSSWRLRKAEQMPVYPDAGALSRVERRLDAAPPLVSVADIMMLRASLARVAAGQAFILQGGDCAESFAEFGADKVRDTYSLLLRMGAMLRAGSGADVVHLARIAGQFAKPRSSGSETIDGITLPTYRGDAVNGAPFASASRTPDPRRLLDAHRQAQVTIDLLHAYAAASYADLPDIHRAVGLAAQARPVSMYTSHEALLLNYEQALTRFDEASESWWAMAGHMIWIGDRTRAPDGAHVEFARGVANPVGLKCGPSLSSDDLLRLIERLDPDNRPGRLVLIGRFGAGKVGAHLPELMRATRREGRNAIWSVDPMHGNTRSVGALKTRLLGDIIAEIQAFFDIAGAEGVHAGGVHLEMTGAEVTECLGGSAPHLEADLPSNYLTHCDPRLNRAQALDVAGAVAKLLAKAARAGRDAA